MEKFALEKNDRIYIYRDILQQKPTFFHLSLQKRRVENNQSINFSSDTFQYDGIFSDEILVVGQMGCGKTSFLQSLGKNRIFGEELLSVDWITKINLTKSRKDAIR